MTGRRPERIYVDANELFPFTIMDVILALAEDLVVDVVWSDELLDEWQRVIVRDGQRTVESAASVAEAVRRFFASGRIDPESYQHLVDETPGGDPDDRVHTAAAIAGGASVLVTRNRRDFPIQHLSQHGVAVSSSAPQRRSSAALLGPLECVLTAHHAHPIDGQAVDRVA